MNVIRISERKGTEARGTCTEVKNKIRTLWIEHFFV